MNDLQPPAGSDILVIVAHPSLEQSRANLRLMQAAAGASARVEVRDLYALYPDYLIDTAAEQARLQAATLVVWPHPIHWYSMPPLMKLYVDEVLSFGWAYGPDGNALRGKDLWLVATTGGPENSAHAAVYPQRLSSYPNWPEIDDLPECVECEVPASARPVEAPETTDRLQLLGRAA